MAKRSKRYKEAEKLVEKNREYTLPDAVALIQKFGAVKFPASVELHVKLGVDPKKADQIVRGSMTFPHATGKTVRIAVFAEGSAAKEAEVAGADLVGGQELIKDVKAKNGIDADVCVAHPSMMKYLGQVAKVLGPRGLMPNPKNETVTPDVGKAIRELKSGRVTFRNDDSGNLHTVIGKAADPAPHLIENAQAFLEAIRRVRPASAKGTFVVSTTLSPSMGPSVRIVL